MSQPLLEGVQGEGHIHEPFWKSPVLGERGDAGVMAAQGGSPLPSQVQVWLPEALFEGRHLVVPRCPPGTLDLPPGVVERTGGQKTHIQQVRWWGPEKAGRIAEAQCV